MNFLLLYCKYFIVLNIIAIIKILYHYLPVALGFCVTSSPTYPYSIYSFWSLGRGWKADWVRAVLVPVVENLNWLHWEKWRV